MIFTLTVVESPAALPAAPLKSGVVSLVAVRSSGVVSVTAGRVVSTVQVALAGVGSTLPGGVDRAHLEGVGGLGEPRVVLRRGARAPASAVELALECGVGLVRDEPRSGFVNGVPPAGRLVIVVSGGVASTVKAGSVTKCVESFCTRTLQAPSFAAPRSWHGRVS